MGHANLAVNVLSARSLIEAFGTAGVCAVIFAETGLLIGFFLPGDSLLFTAGFFASKSVNGVHLHLESLVPGVVAGALIGAEVGYLIGSRAGPRLFARERSRFFKQDYVDRAEEYFTRFGPGKAVVLARFVPIVRTFLNPLCGVLRMRVRDFTLWNVVGGVPWAAGLTLLGYGVGSSIHGSIDRYILPLVAIIIVISLLPIAVEAWRERRRRAT